jgi:hypothetical protein
MYERFPHLYGEVFVISSADIEDIQEDIIGKDVNCCSERKRERRFG